MIGGLLLLVGALAAPGDFNEVACAEVADGPPKGARALMESVLPQISEVRRAVHQQAEMPRPASTLLQRWLETELPLDALGAHAARIGDRVVLELQAPERAAVIEANVTVVIDTSSAMTAVFSRKVPPLQDSPPTRLSRPVTRMMLAKESLFTLVDALPEGSQLTVVASDGALGRVVLLPTTSTDAMKRAIDLLRPEILDRYDERLSEVIEEVGKNAFKRCADNRAFLLTSRTDDTATKNAAQAIRNFGAADAQVWTFGIGTFQELDLEGFVTDQPSNMAQWIINGSSDAALIWKTLFTAGGASARDVRLVVMADGTPVYDERFAMLGSGEAHVALLDVSPEAELILTLSEGETVVLEQAIERVEKPPEWARVRLDADAWSNGRSPRNSRPRRGVASELSAWSVLTGASPVADPLVQVTGVWNDVGPGGPYLVVDLAWTVDELDPGTLQIETATGEILPPRAWDEEPRLVRFVFNGEADEVRAIYDGEIGPWVRVQPPGKRGAHDVILRHAQQDLSTAAAVLADGMAAAVLYEPDEILTSLVARLNFDLQELDGAETWAQKCTDSMTGVIAVDCRIVLGQVYEARQRPEEAEEIYIQGAKRYPWAHQLWSAAGELSFAAEDNDRAERRFLKALETGASSNPTCVRLADIMDRRGLPGLAAVALSRVLLIDPTQEEIRDRLFKYFETRWKKAPAKWGKLGTVRPPRGKTSPGWMRVLLFRWAQAYRRELVRTPDSTNRWNSVVPQPFDAIHREKTLLSGAYRIGFTPGTIPANRVKYADEIEAILEKQVPKIR